MFVASQACSRDNALLFLGTASWKLISMGGGNAQDEADVVCLVSMGFPESDARVALEHCAGAGSSSATGIVQAAMEHLFSLTAECATGAAADAKTGEPEDTAPGGLDRLPAALHRAAVLMCSGPLPLLALLTALQAWARSMRALEAMEAPPLTH